ncbi:hypothetical protein LTR10_018252 [Elasticomyces elasticus]|uniref:Nephrocystin 3-like N-terminal domain-containing protein n=1 Tax=Exophiala sideris TaxID=1016849 RepID=A0ABR0JIT9_9EURO|nr:hypothetical protein LTR10_018252 [Elasticomyces elasticus]KAK5034506.1 hypothetical protein LTS07_003427 [Exophiala sideris]KAK5042802.1 hypothetical protein LTR13_001650 [Exophiala sideris]KAK5065885.1 hypothetical protein LTR69_003435 [Exophiala sideris]KAK5185653.1 hypothetical protein LTR44_001702 [Eurotiomycetes sp. CCFEE 6388]
MAHSEETGHREMALLTKIRSRPDAGDATIPTFPNGIKVWYDPGHADVDIVFIHGLTGDRERTWTHEAALEPWPEAILPDHLPSARILTFGYDAYIVRKGKAVTNQLMDHSKDFLNALTSQRHSKRASSRALIFVAHSLGGLVCKDAILHSRNNPEPHLRAIYESTVAIAFLGTPHGGSDLASWARLPVKALGVLKSTNTDLLSVLQTSSEVLRRVQDDFLSMIRDLASQGRSLKITCFWESQPMPFAGTIVERSSATLPGYNAISIHANHSDMVRFHAPEDPGFLSVLGELRRWLVDIQASELDLTADTRARELEEKRLEQTRIECLKSLTFAEMSARKSNIDEPSPQTCEWIFHDRHYQSWATLRGNRESKNLLWIKGKPGSGKSTLMKQITQEHEQRSLTNGTSCLSFFFNARGAQLERSTLGLYRTLLFQLLQKSKATMAQFLPRFLRKEEQHLGEKLTWQMTELSNFFHAAISEKTATPLGRSQEGGAGLEKSSAAAVSNGATIKICLSSRHYPHISLRIISGHEIYVERHNSSDIRRYVSQELVLGESDLRIDLAEGIVNKAGGIFFWVLFMVRRLLKASDQGYTASQMRSLLQNVPGTLEGLFEETLRSMEPDRRDSFATMAPWIICAFRALELYELYVAIAFTHEEPPLSLVDPKLLTAFDQQRFKRYITDISGGLFESVSVGGQTVVQVIHESFREFFLNSDDAAVLRQLPSGQPFLRHAHERILAASEHYFNVKELREPLPTKLDQMAWSWSQSSQQCFTGALSSPQCDTLDILFQDPLMVDLDVSEMACITRRVNNLVIFVNKAMKDGFVLKEASTSDRGWTTSTDNTAFYLRMFGHGMVTKTLKDELGTTTGFGPYNEEWKVYDQNLGMRSLQQKLKSHRFEMGLAFYMLARQTPHMRELEECWKRGRFPSFTTPLQDWEIMEEFRFKDELGLGGGTEVLTTFLQPAGAMECSSIILKLCPANAREFRLSKYGAWLEATGPDSYLQIITTRLDWELKHYALWKNKFGELKHKRSMSPDNSRSWPATEMRVEVIVHRSHRTTKMPIV